MTTPRVTVPVEQPLVDWFSQFIERHQEGCGSDTDALIARPIGKEQADG